MELEPATNLWRQANLLTGGKLADLLREKRAAGISPELIARQLESDHGAIVSTRTIWNWCRQIGAERSAS